MTLLLILITITLLQVTYLTFKDTIRNGLSKRSGLVFIDTSALMDARIVTAARTGFMPRNLCIPKSVITELQLLADQADSEKRLRARRGLDAIAELQSTPHVAVTILDDGRVGEGGVDARLIELAQKRGGSICTIDFNLNKAASVQDIVVLNINELAGSIRMAFLPGETISLTLTQKGQNASQAVGYLSDGTMVVVDKASAVIGKSVEIEFIRSLQTSAGRMMFAKLVKPTEEQLPNKKSLGRQPVNAKTETKPNRQPRKHSKEDSLINLVNEQQ